MFRQRSRPIGIGIAPELLAALAGALIGCTSGTDAAPAEQSASGGSSGSAGAGGAGGSSGNSGAGGAGPVGGAGPADGADGGADGGAGPVGGADGSAGGGGSGGATASGGAAGIDGSLEADAAENGDATAVVDAPIEQEAGPEPCRGILGHPSAPCDAYPKRTGFTLSMVEDFDQPIDLGTDPLWTWSDGQSDQGLCRFTKGAITFAGGNAIFTMDIAPSGQPSTPSFAEGTAAAYPAPMSATNALVSGEMRSKYNNFRYGYYEVRIKTPRVTKGNFVTGMYAYRTPKWQNFREVVIELQALKNMICPTDVCNGDNRAAWDASFAFVGSPAVPFDSEDGFHTFSFEWLPDVVRWYADRDTYPDPIEVYTGTGNARIPELSTKLIMNIWAFPNNAFGGGNPSDNQYPMQTEIDWVRFYKWDGETVYPCSPTPDCLPAGDRDYSKNNPEDGIPATPSGM